ncbi:MAG TPA: nucleotidyltransferase domain-containing protein [Ktedonobacterales bacterium]|nr:nucleotidyltransferase domain-containing protein [Ktedonobacterales bacterium]
MDEIEQQRQAVIDRIVAVCQADDRVVATFLGGSYARGATDAYSDIDCGLITTDAAYDQFFAERAAFVRQLGEPIFLEDYRTERGDWVFFALLARRAGAADQGEMAVECELMLARASAFQRMHVGPHRVLLDKVNLLTGVAFAAAALPEDELAERVRSQITWFWHDLTHHVTTPLARGRWWSAYGGLQDLRLTCVNLARLQAGESTALDGYEKIEETVPAERLAPLAVTCCPLERAAMLEAASALVGYYRDLALPLAQRYGVAYPTALDRVMTARLERLRASAYGH